MGINATIEKRELEKAREKPEYDYFFSLMRPSPVKKKRECIRCGKEFHSKGVGNRVCCPCTEKPLTGGYGYFLSDRGEK